MNLANKLTLLRVFMIPIFLIFALIESIPYNCFFALGIFALASITDALDGYIARNKNMITDFGKFLDPLADKVLVMAAIIAFCELGFIGSTPVIIILTREFMVTSLRLVANKSDGEVIAAGFMGKLKTATTMLAIVIILLLKGLEINARVDFPFNINIINDILIWISTVLTVISGGQYLFAYRKFIDPSK